MCAREYDVYYYFVSFGGVFLFLIQKTVSHLARKNSPPPSRHKKPLKTYEERNFVNSLCKDEVKIQKCSYSLGLDHCSIEIVYILRHACA